MAEIGGGGSISFGGPPDWGLYGTIAAILSLLDFLYRLIVFVANYIWFFLVGFVRALSRIADVIGRYLRQFIVGRLIPLLRTLAEDYKILRNWILRTLGPVIRIVQRIRQWYFVHILPWQKLIIEIISRVRVALQIFRLLGFKWAAKLDEELQRIQAWVTRSIVDVLKTLNTISSILEVIVDPGMILRKDFFLGTLFTNLAAIKRAVSFGANNPLTASEAQRVADRKAMLRTDAPIVTRNPAGGVTYSSGFAALSGRMDNAARRRGLVVP